MHVEHRRAERHNRISCCWRKDVRCMSTASQGISSGENIHMRILPYRVRSIAMGNHAPCQYKGCIDQVRPAADIPPRAWSQVADADVIPFFLTADVRACMHHVCMHTCGEKVATRRMEVLGVGLFLFRGYAIGAARTQILKPSVSCDGIAI